MKKEGYRNNSFYKLNGKGDIMNNIVIRKDTEKHMKDLKLWLETTKEVQLEGMADFFAVRLMDYEKHMQPWSEGYRQIANVIPEQTKHILDIGCGTGLEVDEIYKRFPKMKLTGIDLSKEMLTKLMEKHITEYENHLLELICGDYFTYPLASTYDIVISFQSLHHYSPQKKLGLFKKLYDSLLQGGQFIYVDYIACCQEEETICYEECLRRRDKWNVPEEQFIHFDTPLTLEHEVELLKAAGFKVEVRETVEAVLFLAKKEY